ncbi:Uncharacterized [Moorella glycerini]|uniref:Uncharacterized protein n=1 Tax=Neomoorella stamsii TaxID=1266720 RepID=A0A9X7P7F1_9FIRM|nr:hypothetical protein MOST_03140 [Moorella stamsii]CEP67238.1 Uncharacterized [Moorella glycerini]
MSLDTILLRIEAITMLAIVNSVVLVGLEGHEVRVEVDISSGLPLCESTERLQHPGISHYGTNISRMRTRVFINS